MSQSRSHKFLANVEHRTLNSERRSDASSAVQCSEFEIQGRDICVNLCSSVAPVGLALLFLLSLSQLSTLHAQPAADASFPQRSTLNPQPTADPLVSDRVLELDGEDSYMELPTDAFTNLTQATVELWAKFQGGGTGPTIFSYGRSPAFLGISAITLTFPTPTITPAGRPGQSSLFHGYILPLYGWFHLAAVSGPGGKKVYLNGVLVGQHANTNSFASAPRGGSSFVGRATDLTNFFKGQMDEIRIWKTARTEAQI